MILNNVSLRCHENELIEIFLKKCPDMREHYMDFQNGLQKADCVIASLYTICAMSTSAVVTPKTYK